MRRLLMRTCLQSGGNEDGATFLQGAKDASRDSLRRGGSGRGVEMRGATA